MDELKCNEKNRFAFQKGTEAKSQFGDIVIPGYIEIDK